MTSAVFILLRFFCAAWLGLFLLGIAGTLLVCAWRASKQPTRPDEPPETTALGFLLMASGFAAASLVLGLYAYSSAVEWLS